MCFYLLSDRYLGLVNNDKDMINRIQSWFETRAFGVCEWLGKKLGIKSTKIRMYFIYLTFFTVGSPIIIYFFMAFFLENKRFFKPPFRRRKRKSVWDL
jgi:phage shock protein C